MDQGSRLLYIHGSESNSQTFKAQVLRKHFPWIIIPDFTGPLAVRMDQLEAVLKDQTGWTLIGSSLGGLMAALFTARHPAQVSRLVLLAPALTLPEFAGRLPDPVRVPTLMVHGSRDEVVPPGPARTLAESVFPDLTYMFVDDDHRLHKTAEELDWKSLLEVQTGPAA